MYQQFYGLKDIPFSLAPDPAYLFRTESLLEVFANLQYGIESGKGLICVTGEVGTGKTTALRSLLQSLDRSVLAAYLFNPLLSTEEFFDLLASEFRFKSQPSKAAMLRLLGHALMSRHTQGMRTVLVLDEAHLLPPHLLEEIRLLSNFETNREKLFQIILCGQPELHGILSQPEFRQLKQRVSLKCSIKVFNARETAGYIRWRLRVAGAEDLNLFEAGAIEMIHRYSGGIPRLINNICDNALLSGFSLGSPRITETIVEDVIEELDLAPTIVASEHTIHETVAEQERRAMQGPAQSNAEGAKAAGSNVRYIRQAAEDKSKFTIKTGTASPGESPRFFARVRVTKNS